MKTSHPLAGRKQVMGDCDCCDRKGQQCIVCGWHEEQDNGVELHERHQRHLLAEEHERERAERSIHDSSY